MKNMSDIDTKTILDTVEIIKGIKNLSTPTNPYLPVYAALGGAFIGAIAGIIPTIMADSIKDRKKKKSVTLSLYSEVKANLELYEHRKYILYIKKIINNLESGQSETQTLVIEVSDNRFSVYNSQLENVGVLDSDIAVLVVRFYQIMEGIIQDVKPGGGLNIRGRGLEEYRELLFLTEVAFEVGNQFLSIVEKRYGIDK